MAKNYHHNNFELKFDEFLELAERIDRFSREALKEAVENSLVKTHEYVTAEIDKAVASSKFKFDRPGRGRTKASIIREATVIWSGTKAQINMGFDLKNGGQPVVYLMYGTPHIEGETKLKNAATGKGKHKKKIQAIQAAEFDKVVERYMNR